MANVYEALRRAEAEHPGSDPLLVRPWNGDATPLRARRPEPANTLPTKTISHPRLVTLGDGDESGAEQFRVMAVRLKDLREQRQLKKVLVTSSVAGEGKTVIAANLAVSIARDVGDSVLLISADLRTPNTPSLFECNGATGLADCLQTNCSVNECMYKIADLPLWFLPPGTAQSRGMKLMQSAKLKELLEGASQSFEWVLVDSSPLFPFADASVWARLVDGVVLVIREGYTPRKELQKANDALQAFSLVGVVVNECNHMNGNGTGKYKPAA